MRTKSSLLPAILALGMAMPLLASCDGARQSVAEAIRPASAAEVAGLLREQIAKGDFGRASADGAAWLKDGADPSGMVAWETARASAQAGKVDAAIRYVGLAVQGGAVDAVSLMSEPMLEPVRLDPRLVALAAGGEPVRASAVAPASVAAHPVANPAAAAIGADGVSASAGDVSVRLPD